MSVFSLHMAGDVLLGDDPGGARGRAGSGQERVCRGRAGAGPWPRCPRVRWALARSSQHQQGSHAARDAAVLLSLCLGLKSSGFSSLALVPALSAYSREIFFKKQTKKSPV